MTRKARCEVSTRGDLCFGLELAEIRAIQLEEIEVLRSLRERLTPAVAAVQIAMRATIALNGCHVRNWPRRNDLDSQRDFLTDLLWLDARVAALEQVQHCDRRAMRIVDIAALDDPTIAFWDGFVGNAFAVAAHYVSSFHSRVIGAFAGDAITRVDAFLWQLNATDTASGVLRDGYLRKMRIPKITNAEREWFDKPELQSRNYLFAALERLRLRLSVSEFRDDPATMADDSDGVQSEARPTTADLASAAGISNDTFRRIREDAEIVIKLHGGAARKRQYTPEEVDRLIAAAIRAKRMEREKCARKWARWGSNKAASTPQSRN